MTTRALVRDHVGSTDTARAAMIDLAVAATATLDGARLRALPEHLVRRVAGREQRSVRILFDGGDTDGWTFGVEVAGRGEVPVEILPAPGGHRLLIPCDGDRRDVRITVRHGRSTAVLAFPLQPPRRWSIHLVHHSHLDIGYTDPQSTVLGEHVKFLDSCLDLTRATDGWQDNARFRWAVESLWSFEQWAEARRERVEEFVERVRAGQIELTAMPYNLHTDVCSTDELHELLGLARRVRRERGVEIRSAMQTDVPGAVAGLPEALAQNGVRYLSVAHNWAGRSVPNITGGSRLPRLFRWRAPSGGEVLVWMTDSPHGLAYMEGPVLGFDSSYKMVEDLLPAYLTSLATRPYPFPPGMFGWHGPQVDDREPYPWDVLHLRVQGHFGDNAPPRLIMAEIVRQWNETWAGPTLRLSTNTDFFLDAEARVGDRVPTFEGDWGDWWVEGVGSGARPQAMVRRAQANVVDATTLYGLATLLDPTGGARYAEAARHGKSRVYASVSLFNEHTWGAANPWTYGDTRGDSGEQQWHWKHGYALHGRADADTYLDHAVAALGARLPAVGELTFWAVNPTVGVRTAEVRLFVRESRVPLDRTLSVVDGRTGLGLPTVEEPQTNPVHRDAGRWLRVLVTDIPPFGLVRLDVYPADGTADSGPTPATTGQRVGGSPTDTLPGEDDLILENEHLRVRIDLRHACVAGIFEKAVGRELVDQDAVVGFNGYVYDTYTTAGGYNHQSGRVGVSEGLELLGSRTLARPAVLLDRIDNDLEQRVTFEYAADGVRSARTTVRLGRHDPYVVFDDHFDKPATMTKESAYLAFPFALDNPTVHYEITGALTGTDLPHVPGAPPHMRAVRSFVSMVDANGPVAWVTRDAPLVEPETIALPYAPFPDSTAPRRPATVYSWVHNNLWDTNFPSQQAFDTTFRYAVGVRRAGETLDADALALRTALEIDHPLIAVPAYGPAGEQAPSELRPLSVDDPRVTVLGVVPLPEADGGGLLVRLQSFATEPVEVRVACAVPIIDAALVTYLGDPIGVARTEGDVAVVELPRLGVSALRVRTGDQPR